MSELSLQAREWGPLEAIGRDPAPAQGEIMGGKGEFRIDSLMREEFAD